jgi:hypothetical protein
MSAVILIDFDTLQSQPDNIKALVTEHVVKHPDTLISVLNARGDAQPIESATLLKTLRFPFDIVVCNPLSGHNSDAAFKTMFAVAAQDNPEGEILLVIDRDEESLQMWRDSGVRFTFNPETNVEA